MKKGLAIISVLVSLCGCIENDLPYPVRVAEITAMEVEDASSVKIDPARRSVTIELEETADISKVRILSAAYKHEFTVSEPELVKVHDLSEPLKVTLKTYQDYEWTLTAIQYIERYFTVKGQVGAAVIDDVNRRAVISVSGSTSMKNIAVTSLKLGPAGASYKPTMSEIHDFTDGVEVEVSFGGRTENWQLYAEKTDVSVQMTSIDAWTGCAYLSASGVADSESGFLWRAKGGSEWIEAEGVTMEGGTFSVCLDGLQPKTAYECQAYSGGDNTETVEFVTEAADQLPNAGFEAFSHAESQVYCSWFDPASSELGWQTKWWDSGNIGSTTVGSAYCIAIPDTDIRHEGSASASLVSRNVVIKFAAGNTFSGEFAGLVGTQGGLVNFGRPWVLRPRAIRLWARYECGKIDVVDGYPAGNPVKVGDPDFCSMMVALGDWDYRKFGGTPQSPVQVNTTDKGTFLDPGNEAVIAYGYFSANSSSNSWSSLPQVIGSDADGWMELEIPLDYRAVNRKPTHIIVSFASSALGDYFTGSSQSRLWIDDIRLIY